MGTMAYIYMLLDKCDNLLYVGSTKNAHRRLKQHLSTRPPKALHDNREIDHALVAYAGNIQNAMEGEAWLIQNAKPAWNTIIPDVSYHDFKTIKSFLMKLTWATWIVTERD